MSPQVKTSLWLVGAAVLSGFLGQSHVEAAGWSHTDIGAVGAKGTATVNARKGEIKVSSGGSDIGASADSLHYLYQPLVSDGTIVVRLTALQKFDGWTKGGLMLRQSLAPGSVNASLLVTVSNGVLFQYRTSEGGSTAVTTSAGSAPSWLRLSRSGTTIAAATSTDGETWRSAGTASVPFTGGIYAGMAMASHRTKPLSTGTFDSVEILGSEDLRAPGTDMVAAWSFDEGAGTVATDELGLHNGTISGAAWTSSGKFGGALVFDGMGSLVTVNDSAALDLSSAMTLQAWVYPTTLSSLRSLMMKEGGSGPSYAMYASGDAGTPTSLVTAGSMEAGAAGTVPLPLSKWSHVAATYDGATLRLFVNGVHVGSRAVTGTLLQTSGALRIGWNAVWGDFFHGTIDNVRIYRRALSANEIQADMTRPVAPGSTPDDNTRPTVAVTAPASGSSVSGVVTVSASAADNVGVTSVQLLVGAANLGPALTKSPYSASWDTTATADGVYTLTAVARDAAGNSTVSSPVSVTVNNVVAPPNPRRVEFTSPDHETILTTGEPAVTSYTLEIWQSGANPATSQPYVATSIGKPASTGTLVSSDQEAFLDSLPKGQQYFTTVTVTGPGGSARSSASDPFVLY